MVVTPRLNTMKLAVSVFYGAQGRLKKLDFCNFVQKEGGHGQAIHSTLLKSHFNKENIYVGVLSLPET